jgi:Holliday junction resolvase
MKRLPRAPEKFDALELYSAVSRQQGYRIGMGDDLVDFQQRIGAALKASLQNPNVLHGKRVEAMFAHVLGALGGCKYIKQEDGGAVFSSTDEFEIPDYRVVTNEDQLLLIEVKNFHMKDLTSRFYLQRAYLAKLAAYAEMNHAGLRVAIYFSRINKWILLSTESFLTEGRRAYIDFPHGMARNELSLLGDRMIATLPPLSIEFTGDPHDERAIVQPDGTAVFTIRHVQMKCADRVIANEDEQRIAFYLMRYGRWTESEAPATIVDGRLVSLAFVSAPDEGEANDQPFRMLGDLSSMVSTAYRELTVGDNGVFSLDVKYDPTFFELKIPDGYKGDALPLWQFAIQANPDFRYG